MPLLWQNWESFHGIDWMSVSEGIDFQKTQATKRWEGFVNEGYQLNVLRERKRERDGEWEREKIEI